MLFADGREAAHLAMIGQTIAHYKILAKLGEGGMGVVYKAEDTKLRRTVALKFPPIDKLAGEEEKARFVREAQAAAALNHPNICTVYEIGEAAGHSFIAMEFVEGESVRERVRSRPLPLDEALDIAIQAAQGLQAAHENDVVHRDVKSANLMLTEKGRVKVMDFGLAQVGDRSQLTKTGSTLGTTAYMSPEQALAQPTDRRTDIWSLGVVLYEMLTGRLPFAGEVEAAVAYAVVNTEPEPPTALRSGLPIELDRIVDKALAKGRDDRYQHVEDLAVDLEALQRSVETGAGLNVSRQRRRRRNKTAVTRRSVAVATAGALVSLGVVAVYWGLDGGFLAFNENKPIDSLAVFAVRQRAGRFRYRVPERRDQREPHYEPLSNVRPEGQIAGRGVSLQGAGHRRPAGRTGTGRAGCVARQARARRRCSFDHRRAGGYRGQHDPLARRIPSGGRGDSFRRARDFETHPGALADRAGNR